MLTCLRMSLEHRRAASEQAPYILDNQNLSEGCLLGSIPVEGYRRNQEGSQDGCCLYCILHTAVLAAHPRLSSI